MSDRELPFGAYAPAGAVARILAATRALPVHGLGKTIGFGLRRLAMLLMGGKPLDVDAYGAKFRLFPYNNVCEGRILFFPRQFDEDERALILQRLTPDFRFVDVGANIGGYALAIAAKAGADARVLAIEPLPDIFGRLVYNIRLNPFGNLKALELAVADKDGDMTLFIDQYNRGESSIKIIRTAEGNSVRVPVRKLLTVLKDEKFSKVDALKLDVEGAEDIILEAFFADAPESLYPGLIILQSTPNRWQIDVLGLIEANGYKKIAETRNNIVYERGYRAD